MKTERVPLATKLAYGSGQMAEAVKNTAFELFLFFYYNQVLGLSGSLAGLALSIALCVDGITDPLIGSLSDGSHFRWGREGVAGITVEVFRSLLSPEDMADIAAEAIHPKALKAYVAYALSFTEGIRSGRLVPAVAP